jgi:hypothetical protein
MKANELRIGNYLELPTRDEEIIIVEEILRDNFIICNVTSNEWPITDYAPIPLTEEWLLKFGFEKPGDVWYNLKFNSLHYKYERHRRHGELSCTLSYYCCIGDGRRDGAYLGYELKYVHQLQNLYFALTGEELEIKK